MVDHRSTGPPECGPTKSSAPEPCFYWYRIRNLPEGVPPTPPGRRRSTVLKYEDDYFFYLAEKVMVIIIIEPFKYRATATTAT